jgi:hypothetical protein
VSVLLGKGNGGFHPAKNSPVVPFASPFSLALGDFNADGKQDVATANGDAHHGTLPSLSVLLGKGNGTFGPASTFSNGASPAQWVAVEDLNRDGKHDLVTANRGTNDVSVLLGNGDGIFATAKTFTVLPGERPVSVAVGDFDGDGKHDLVTANYGSNNVSVLLGLGDGSFGVATIFAVGDGPVDSPRPESVAVGDVNGDRKQDLITANRETNKVAVLLNNSL